MPDWRGVSQLSCATGTEIRKRLLGQTVKPTRDRIAFDFLVEPRRFELLEPGTKPHELLDGQFGYGFFDVLEGR